MEGYRIFFVKDGFLSVKEGHDNFYNETFASNVDPWMEVVEHASNFVHDLYIIELPFLDVLVDRINNEIKTSVCRKPTLTNRELQFIKF